MTSPPATLTRACADGASRLRDFRARSVPVGFLVLAASLTLGPTGWMLPALAQFPIRQIPSRSPTGVATPPTAVGAVSDSAPGRSTPFAFASPYHQAAGALGTAGTGSSLSAWVHQPHPAVARIVVPERSGVSLGSGTLVDVRGDYGLVVTNWHVVRDAAGPIQVEFPNGFQSTGEVVKLDPDWDLAALSIRRPPVAPVPISPQAPRPGQWLAIAGYGSGSWRMVSGRCTQYLAPGAEFPYELVELSAEARQGDSGGPIFNERGELAGVLFGSGPGYTSGSYGGRVLHFLASVVPGGLPGSDAIPPGGTSPGQLAVAMPAEARERVSLGRAPAAGGRPYGSDLAASTGLDGVITPPPQATALHTSPPGASTAVPPGTPPANAASSAAAPQPPQSDRSPRWDAPPLSSTPAAGPLTPVQPQAGRLPGAVASVPWEPSGASREPADDGLRPVVEEEDPRVAVIAGRVYGARLGPEAARADEELGPASLHAELPPRRAQATAPREQPAASTEEMVALVWRWLAGESLYDQGKTVLAIIGLVALAVLVFRGSGRSASCDME